MNDIAAFRRIAATLTIGSFSFAALLGIIALVGASDFGENQDRVLLTTLVVGCASVCVLCYLATSGSRWAPVGVLGALVVVLPTVTSLMLVWGDYEGESTWRSFGIGVVLASTLAQICLLLALASSRRNLAPVLGATVLLASVLAFTITGVIVEAIDGDIWKFVGVVAILDVLGTLVTIALAKFVRHEDSVEVLASRGLVRTTLGADQSAELEHLARTTGRPTDQLVAEAVDRFLHHTLSQ